MFKNSFIEAVVATLVIAGAFACGKTTEPMQGTGTNTNWLRSCEASSECDPGADCLCGVCTRSCASQAQCDDVSEANCAPLTAAACGAGALGAACLEQCSSDDDCDLIDDGRCLDGACVPAQPPQPPALDGGARDAAGSDPTRAFTGDGNTLPAECELSVATVVASPAPPVGGAGGDGAPPPVEGSCVCTRRPGDGNSFRCPMGTGASVVREVGPEGATVQLDGTASTLGTALELRIPPNALRETVAIRITETSIAPPDGVVDWSPIYHFEPEDLRFEAPVEVKLPWSSDSPTAGGLAIYWSEQGSCALAALDDNYQNAGFNQGSVLGLGWAIVAAASVPDSTCP